IRALLPTRGHVARGVRIGGAEVPSGMATHVAAERRASEILARTITVRWQAEAVITATLDELGAEIDVAALARDLGRVGHDGALPSEAGRATPVVPLRARRPGKPPPLRGRRSRGESNPPPKPPNPPLPRHSATPHQPGRYVDVYAMAGAIERAVAEGRDTADVP